MTVIRNCIIMSFFIVLSSFNRPADMGDLIASLKAGDHERIATFLNQTVDIKIPGYTGSYSKSEARKMIQMFFAQHPLKTFQLIHRADFSNTQMCVGTIVTADGSYRTTLLLEEQSGKQWLKEVRFE